MKYIAFLILIGSFGSVNHLNAGPCASAAIPTVDTVTSTFDCFCSANGSTCGSGFNCCVATLATPCTSDIPMCPH